MTLRTGSCARLYGLTAKVALERGFGEDKSMMSGGAGREDALSLEGSGEDGLPREDFEGDVLTGGGFAEDALPAGDLA